jgi:hypothetical protein
LTFSGSCLGAKKLIIVVLYCAMRFGIIKYQNAITLFQLNIGLSLNYTAFLPSEVPIKKQAHKPASISIFLANDKSITPRYQRLSLFALGECN